MRRPSGTACAAWATSEAARGRCRLYGARPPPGALHVGRALKYYRKPVFVLLDANGGRVSDHRPRVCIIGLDGGTFRVLGKWVDAGVMPFTASLLGRGHRRLLRSTTPPVTGPAWTSMTTGVGPAAHGVIDFIRWHTGRPGGRVINSTDIDVPRLWDIAARHGLTAGVLYVPVTWPAREVNGYLVSGMLTPQPCPEMAWPPTLFGEMHAAGLDPFEHRLSHKRDAACVREICDSHRRFEEAAAWLLERRTPDVFMCVLRETDRVQHRVWPYCDRDPAARDGRIAGVVGDFWRAVDVTIERLMGFFGPETTFFLASDHGFGPMTASFSVNRFLSEAGFLAVDAKRVRKARRAHATAALLRGALMRTGLLEATVRLVSRLKGAEQTQALSHDAFAAYARAVDWSRTRACAKSRSDGGIYINLKGREPFGIVEPGEEYERVRDELIAALGQLRHPETGEPLAEDVRRKEDVHHGPYLALAPDVYVSFGGGVMGRRVSLGGRLVERSEAGGLHAQDGMLLALGPGIAAGEGDLAQITDVAPTVLHALGLPIPTYMEGRVLTDIYDAAHAAAHPVTFSDEPLPQPGEAAPSAAPPGDEEVKARLRDLGYL
jgi:predicted AlkP superfamily phosphohydrolase/phosphomutase